jgi:hypothetical protein
MRPTENVGLNLPGSRGADPVAPVGLYSISVRGFDVAQLLRWSAAHTVPFLHLRGGARGFDLAAQSPQLLRQWGTLARGTVPITGVTADTDLADLLGPGSSRAREDLVRLAAAATAVGAGWIRLLARRPFDNSADVVVPDTGLRVLIEPHHPDWLTERPRAGLHQLLEQHRELGLLADTAQLSAALDPHRHAAGHLHAMVERADVLHLSDSGAGIDTPGHHLVADQVVRRVQRGQRVEIAVEWTGPDRSASTCLSRYQAHAQWWASRAGESTLGPGHTGRTSA